MGVESYSRVVAAYLVRSYYFFSEVKELILNVRQWADTPT
jgi:hypothetical protein